MRIPRVSVIIPTYNHAKFVGEAISSVIEQTYQDFEIIVVDDGSTDNSREVIAEFDKQVRYIEQINQGLAGARNTGIRAAKGEFIGLLDADDLWLPHYLEKMISLTDQYPEAGVYYCSAKSIDEFGRELPQVFGGPPRSPDSMYDSLLRANFLIPSTILIRRDVIMAADLFDESLRSCEDWDLWLRILPQEGFIGTSECLVKYRIHKDSLSTNPIRMQQATMAVIQKKFGPDDGHYPTWSWERRRGYGGVYRYNVLVSAQRQNDWKASGEYLRRALIVDPTLSADLDIFYDLAHTGQPVGYRGTSIDLDFESNSEHVRYLLNYVFTSDYSSELERIRQLTFSSANYALGLVAYKVGKYRDSRNHLLTAVWLNTDLIRDSRAIKTLMKSFLGKSVLNIVRNLRGLISDRGRI